MRSPLTAAQVAVARVPQPRADGARLDVYDDAGALATFFETSPAELEGASVVRLTDLTGAEVLTVLHPGRTSRARVDVGGAPIGFVSRVGRVRANVELHGPGRRPVGDPVAVLKPLDGDGWSGAGSRLRWWRLSHPTAGVYGEARYTLEFAPTVDVELRRLVLGAVVLVDRAVVQLPM